MLALRVSREEREEEPVALALPVSQLLEGVLEDLGELEEVLVEQLDNDACAESDTVDEAEAERVLTELVGVCVMRADKDIQLALADKLLTAVAEAEAQTEK
jgi:K+/H+ antiporter YhaU regulatory subunit KhtT